MPMMTFLKLAAMTGTLAVAAPPPAWPANVGADSEQIYGHWKVVGVAVPNEGVQALVDDDPTYMGRQLTFMPNRLAWDRVEERSTEAPCIAPTITPAPNDADPASKDLVRKIGGPAIQSFSIRCGTGSWGPIPAPAPSMLALPDGTIGLWWFDNGLLKLRKISE